MKNIFILLLIIPLLFSCKKDKLEGEYLIFEGKWKWTESIVGHNEGAPNSSYEIVTSDSFGFPDDYFLEFDRKGKVKFFKNDAVEKKYRIVFNTFDAHPPGQSSTNWFTFIIYLDNDSGNTLNGHISQDTLRVQKSNIPLENKQTYPTVTYSHRYFRVN